MTIDHENDSVGPPWLDAKKVGAIVVLLTLALAAMTAHRVFAAPLWGDELRTWRDGIERPLTDVLHWQHNPDHAPLGHLLARGGAAIFGVQHAWALRLGSWLCGLACVTALWRLGRRIHSDAAGLLMAAMFVVDPTQVFQLTQARMYATMLLASIVAMTLAVRAIRGELRWPAALWMGIAIAVGIWAHSQIYAVVLAIGVVAIVLIARSAMRQTSLMLLLALSIGLALGAQGVHKLIDNRNKAAVVDVNRTLESPPAQLEDASQSLTGHNAITAIVVVSTLIGLGALTACDRPMVALLLALIVAFAVVNLYVAALYRPIAFARYLSIAQPALWAGIAVALVESARLASSRSRAWSIVSGVAFTGWVGLCGFQLTRTIEVLPAHPLAGPFRDAVAYVQAHRSADARVVVLPGSPLATYARYYGLTSDADVDTALTRGSTRGRRRATTAPAVVDARELWLIGIVPVTPRWRNTGDDPLIANATIARARGIRAPATLPAGENRGKSEAIVVRFGPGGVSEATRFTPDRGTNSNDVDAE